MICQLCRSQINVNSTASVTRSVTQLTYLIGCMESDIVSQNVQNVKCNKNYCRSNRQINAKGREIWPTSNGMRDSKVTLLDRSSGSRLVGRHIHEKPPLDTTEFIRHDVIALPGPTT
ncbi:uncharacterized protein LOC118645266 [Monomorium pharaonis]|uniref:uncharacterized protein LOC118645266 n=1 Tax=Monomorium pharaonis TaxID=307658 RepID=UPI0017460C59|nr:uncharacterized protein LOC118645266 [Monomorium pharaonis]